jgi:HAD superfamily hydrolase (TIGR01509 family)
VLFDFQGTIAQVEEPVQWVHRAAAACGATLDPILATSLADQLVNAGRVGGPKPQRIPPHLAEVWADRDLSPDAHRRAYTGLLEPVAARLDGLADALYERVLVADGWQAYPDTGPTFAALHAADIPIVVVSNVGFDIRPLCNDLGFAAHVSAWALSYERGRCKPDPYVFQQACRAVGVDPSDALMIGDTPADAGAVDAGCRVLLLPASPPGTPHGLDAALTLALG